MSSVKYRKIYLTFGYGLFHQDECHSRANGNPAEINDYRFPIKLGMTSE